METNTQTSALSRSSVTAYVFGAVLLLVVGAGGMYLYMKGDFVQKDSSHKAPASVEQPAAASDPQTANKVQALPGTTTSSSPLVQFRGETLTGTAPLTVYFEYSGLASIDYGDGTKCYIDPSLSNASPQSCMKDGILKSHTYAKPGTYRVVGSASLPYRIIGESTVIVK